ncbi:hypothetical protein CGMCC3_g9612 [Colletotrichum fructicola]|nr:uncharacterized protein CGMCC3_g9612 [Colletotrichum fructicola]KAE9574285.1 hypothetical protein CGMCC3_g9612 [Colletotrichum fructicola]
MIVVRELELIRGAEDPQWRRSYVVPTGAETMAIAEVLSEQIPYSR